MNAAFALCIHSMMTLLNRRCCWNHYNKFECLTCIYGTGSHQAVQILGTLLMYLFFIMHPVTALPVTLSAQAAAGKPFATMSTAAVQCMPKDWLNYATFAFTRMLLTSVWFRDLIFVSSCARAQQHFARRPLPQQIAHNLLLQCQLGSLCSYSTWACCSTSRHATDDTICVVNSIGNVVRHATSRACVWCFEDPRPFS